MKNALIPLCFLLLSTVGATQAQEVAVCRNPSGMGYYHFTGLLKEDSAGWEKEEITGGVFTLTRNDKGDMDILYVDTRKKPVSSVTDGAIVRLLRRSEHSATVLVHYPETSTELYTFFKEKNGAHRFTLVQSRTSGFIEKSSLMMGECDNINFPRLK